MKTMTIRTREIDAYENQGALLTLGPSQVLSFTNFNTPQSGTLQFDDSAPSDKEWDFGESATFEGAPATLQATGEAFAGVTVTLLGINILTVQLSTPVRVAVFSSGGEQYLRFFNPDGSDADPAELLDALVTQVVAGLSGGGFGLILQPLVNAILANPLAYVQQNALLTLNLTGEAGMPVVPCFTAGSMIMTRAGEVPVETLAPGDHVLTVDHGFRPIRWIGKRKLTAADFVRAPHLRPICIQPGALGHGLPIRPLIVSPQHRCLIRSTIAARMSGDREVLIAAKHLTEMPGISVVERPEDVTYVHLLLDQHELLFSDGAITESFYLGEQAIASLDAEARAELLELFPDLACRASNETPQRVRSFMSGHVALRLVERGMRNGKPLVEPKSYATA
jgi:hypothetical protein